MANKVLLDEQDGTPKQISFADHAGDFGPTAANSLEFGTPTDCQLSLASVASVALGSATTTGARMSAKVDLGAVRAPAYAVRAAFELAATPTAGAAIYLYWAPSSSATAGTGNPGGVSGSDAAYTGLSNNNDACLSQLILIGVFVCNALATTNVQIAECGRLYPPTRYGSLVVRNASGAAFHSDDAECHVVLDPIYEEIQ